MPELRIRHKKKRDPRRRTLTGADETTNQIQSARELMQQDPSREGKVNGDDSAVRSNVEGFITTTSSSDPTVKAVGVRKIASRHQDCFFLRYGPDTRRCPRPSPITLSTIKNLFVNMFELDQSVLTDPKWHLFILDSSSTWKPLKDVTLVVSHSTVLLVDSADISSAGLGHAPGGSAHFTSRSATASPEDMSLPSLTAAGKLHSSGRNGLWRDHPQRPASTDPSFASNTTDGSGRSSSAPLVDTEEETRRRESLRPLRMSPLSVESSASGVMSDLAARSLATHRSQSLEQLLSSRARGLCHSVRHLKGELDATRSEHRERMAELQVELILTKNLINAAVQGIANSAQICSATKNVHGIEQFRKDRLKIMAVKEDYSKASHLAVDDVRDLERTVEGLRVDAVNRKCRIDTDEVEDMLSSVHTSQSIIDSLKRKYFSLEFSLKDIMKRELEVIVAEEKFMQEESLRLDEAADNCRELSLTLDALKKLSQIQDRRTPSIPYIASTESPDRKALLESISAVFPNHQHRLESLKVAEATNQWRKELHSVKKRLKKFEDNLHTHKKQLRPTGYVEAIDRQRQMKLKAMYMQERIEKSREAVKHTKKKAKALTRRKSDVVAATPSDRDTTEEERQVLELKFIQDQRRKLEEDRLQQLEEQRKLEEAKRHQDEERRRIDREKRLQEEERKQLKEERRKQKARNKLAKEQLQRRHSQLAEWEEYNKQLRCESPRAATLRKELLWQQIQTQAQLELEQEEATEKEKRTSVPQIVINGSTGQTSLAPSVLRKNHGLKDSSGSKDRRSIGYFGEFDAAGVFSGGPLVAPMARNCRRADSIPRQMSHQTHDLKSLHKTPPLLRAKTPEHEHKYRSEESLSQSGQNIYDPPWDQSRVAAALQVSQRVPHGRLSPSGNRRWGKSDVTSSSRAFSQHQHWKSLEDDRGVGKPGASAMSGPGFDSSALTRTVQHNLLSQQQQRYRSSSDHRLAVRSTHYSPVSPQVPVAPVFPNEAVSSYPGHLGNGWTAPVAKGNSVPRQHSHAFDADMRFTQCPPATVRRNPHKTMNISYV